MISAYSLTFLFFRTLLHFIMQQRAEESGKLEVMLHSSTMTGKNQT